MVRFEQDNVAVGKEETQIPRHVAEIRGDGEAAVASRNPKRNVRCVVRNRKGFDYERTERNGLPGRVTAHLNATPGALQQSPVVSKEWRAKSARKWQSVRRMIAMIVGDEQAEGTPRRHQVAAERAHLPYGAGGIHARIDDQPLTA
jgi:hypothetical protein